jgi:hypothetical protein
MLDRAEVLNWKRLGSEEDAAKRPRGPLRRTPVLSPVLVAGQVQDSAVHL